MNKKFITLSIIGLLSIALVTSSFHAGEKAEVYVCGQSKIYHSSKTHMALKRCKSGITKITLSKAKSLGKRSCKCKY